MPDNTKKPVVIRVCNEPSCANKGSGHIMKIIEKAIGLIVGDKNEKYDLNYSACVGCCEFGPNLLVDNELVLRADKDTVMAEIDKASQAVALTPEEKMANLDKALDDLI